MTGSCEGLSDGRWAKVGFGIATEKRARCAQSSRGASSQDGTPGCNTSHFEGSDSRERQGIESILADDCDFVSLSDALWLPVDVVAQHQTSPGETSQRPVRCQLSIAHGPTALGKPGFGVSCVSLWT